ncbi:hypothetical protein BJ508DRAFT_418380, partial [Ascobolus immersus RN42]
MAFVNKLPPELILQITNDLTETDLFHLRRSSSPLWHDPNIRYRFHQSLIPRLKKDDGRTYSLPGRLYDYRAPPGINERLIRANDITAVDNILRAISEREVHETQQQRHLSKAAELSKAAKFHVDLMNELSKYRFPLFTVLSLRLLSRACHHGQLDLVNHILSHPRLHLRDIKLIGRHINPFLALLFAQKKTPRKAILLALLTAGYDFTAPTSITAFPFHLRTDGAPDNGIAPSSWDRHKHPYLNLTPLHCAVWERDVEMVTWLLEKCNVDVNVPVAFGTIDFQNVPTVNGSSGWDKRWLYLTSVNLAMARGCLSAQMEGSFNVADLNSMAHTWRQDMEERLKVVEILVQHGAVLTETVQPASAVGNAPARREGRNPLGSVMDLGYWFSKNGVQFSRLFLMMAVPELLNLGVELDKMTATRLLNHSLALRHVFAYPPPLEMLVPFLKAGGDPDYFQYVKLREFLKRDWLRGKDEDPAAEEYLDTVQGDRRMIWRRKS